MSSLSPGLQEAVDEAREFLRESPGLDHLPLNIFTRLTARGGDAVAIESMLLSERRKG